MSIKMKMTSLPQNPQFIQQVEAFVEESNSLIKTAQFRKCIVILDTQYRKLLPIESPTKLRGQLLRRLCFCILHYFRLKINKSECNSKKSYKLWMRLQYYLRDFNDNIQLIKNKKKKAFYSLQLLRFLIEALKLRALSFLNTTMHLRGALALHQLNLRIILQVLSHDIYDLAGQQHLVMASHYFQLQSFQDCQVHLDAALNYLAKSFQDAYQRTAFGTLEQMKQVLARESQVLVVCLFMMVLNYEQLNNFQKYVETIKLLSWFDLNFQDENGLGHSYFIPILDINKYNLQIVEELEIAKVLSLVIKPPEPSSKVETQIDEHFNEKLFRFTDCTNIHRNYFVFVKPTPEPETAQTDLLDTLKISKMNASQTFQKPTDATQTESTAILRSQTFRKQKSEQQISTRVITENTDTPPQALLSTMVQERKMHKPPENMTLREYYSSMIEKSCQISQINSMAEILRERSEKDMSESKTFDRSCKFSKSQLHFQQCYGAVSVRNERNKIHFRSRQQTNNKKVLFTEAIVESQALLKRVQDESNFNRQKKKLQTTDLELQKDNQVSTLRKMTLKPKEAKEEQHVVELMNEKSKQVIKQMMAEKEAQFDQTNRDGRRSSNVSQHTLLQRLLQQNDVLGKSTYNISQSKKKEQAKQEVQLKISRINNKKVYSTVVNPSSGTKHQHSLTNIIV